MAIYKETHGVGDILVTIGKLLEELFPIYRSLTGSGNRKTLKILSETFPIQIKEIPSGMQVYDWSVPHEYSVNDAWIKNSKGRKLIDFQVSNLHLVGYSRAVSARMTFDELQPRLFTLEELPDAIPYRTTYYKEDWGFCCTAAQKERIASENGKLSVHIDSNFDPKGSMTYGEIILPGRSSKEVLISTYICHPSMANDNLSGCILTTLLARSLSQRQSLKFTYRFIFIPETIGAIAYCALNEETIKNIDIGLIASTCGGPGKLGFKKSFNEEHWINRVVEESLKARTADYEVYDFDPHGSDERQFSTGGFRINTPVISKDKFYEYEYYHTSFDDLDFVKPKQIMESLTMYTEVIDRIESEVFYKNEIDHGEPMLGKHDLYPSTGGAFLPEKDGKTELDLILWLLHYSDGKTPVSEISRLLNVEESRLFDIAVKIKQKGVISEI